MERLNLAGKRVTVMGLGLHGGAVGAVRWLAEQGAQITVTDLRGAPALRESVAKLSDLPDIEFVFGKHREEDFSRADMVVRNPAVPRDSELLQIARAAGVPIEMDSGLFFAACPSEDIIGITGTKGKTTCAKTITRLLSGSGRSVVEVGTDRVSPLAELKHVTSETTVVFELSSWRLEALAERRISPRRAVVTSLYPDHLNTYDSLGDYIETKKTIVRYQPQGGVALLNADDPRLAAWAGDVPGKVLWFSRHDLPEGDGIFVRDHTIWVRTEGRETQLFELATVPLASDHERRNVLPGILLAYLAGETVAKSKRRVQELASLPHRLETVREVRGVVYINDSAATMPDATIAALTALSGKTLIHIIGGGDKELAFAELAQAEQLASIRALLFLPGTATEAIRRALAAAFGKAMPPAYDVTDMRAAVTLAAHKSRTGDVVLLSPAATSFGLFAHEFDRGDQFRAAVAAL
jgi:UDP-N-acetylmuramoylalanine--D-glutamate ligase